MTFTFDEEKHEYKLDGLVIPGVTSILSDMGLSGIHWSILDELRALKNKEIEVCHLSPQALAIYLAGQFGKAAHKATELYDLGTLDESSLDPAIVPYLDAWRKCRGEKGISVIEVELKMYHPVHFFATTIDKVVEINGKLTILEIKTSAQWPVCVGLQTASHQVVYNHNKKRKNSVTQRMAVKLKANGNYEIAPDEMFTKLDWNHFLSALNLTGWKQNNLK